VKRVKENNRVERYLSSEEEMRLFNVMPLYWRLIVSIAIKTELRQSEQMSLLWSDVDLERNRIKLRETKAGEAQEIVMIKGVVEAFKKLQSMQQEENVGPLDSDGKVFYVINQQDSLGNYDRLQYRWRHYLKLAGIENFRWHDLLHTCASRLVMKDTDMYVVMKYLRHKNLSKTERYAHRAKSKLLEKVGVLDNWKDNDPKLAPEVTGLISY